MPHRLRDRQGSCGPFAALKVHQTFTDRQKYCGCSGNSGQRQSGPRASIVPPNNAPINREGNVLHANRMVRPDEANLRSEAQRRQSRRGLLHVLILTAPLLASVPAGAQTADRQAGPEIWIATWAAPQVARLDQPPQARSARRRPGSPPAVLPRASKPSSGCCRTARGRFSKPTPTRHGIHRTGRHRAPGSAARLRTPTRPSGHGSPGTGAPGLRRRIDPVARHAAHRSS